MVNRLAQKGTQVIVPYRDEDEKRHLKVMGDLGQVVPMVSSLSSPRDTYHCSRADSRTLDREQEWDLKNDDQIEECLRHSDVVYNLTGRHYETK